MSHVQRRNTPSLSPYASHVGNKPVCYPNLGAPAGSGCDDAFFLFNESNIPNYTNLGSAPPISADISNAKLHHKLHDPSTAGTAPAPSTLSARNQRAHFCGLVLSKKVCREDTGSASAISTAFNIIKGIMGVGILTVPWSMAQIGVLPSLILFSVSLTVSYISWVLLCVLCSVYGVFSYRDLGLILFGKRFASFLDVALLVFLYLVCSLYVVFVTEFVTEGLSTFGITVTNALTLSSLSKMSSMTIGSVVGTKLFIATAAVFGVLFPLSLLQRLDSLKYSSFCGIVGCLYTVGLVVFTFSDDGDRSGVFIAESVQWVRWHSDGQTIWFWLSSFSVFVAAFNSHYNAPALFGELDGRSPAQFIRISTASFAFMVVINITMALTGYFVFGAEVEQNIIDSIGDTLCAALARLIMTVTIVGTYPLLFWNIKVSTSNLFLYRNVVRLQNSKQNKPRIKKVPRKYTSRCTELALYFAVTVSLYVAALELQDVAVMIAFMQSLLGNAIVFIFPSMFTLKMIKMTTFNPKTRTSSTSSTTHKMHYVAAKVLCYILILFGAVSVFGGSIAAILFWSGYIE